MHFIISYDQISYNNNNNNNNNNFIETRLQYTSDK